MQREVLILDFLDREIFNAVIATDHAPLAVRRGVRFTRMCIARLPAASMIRYFWSSIAGTGRSEVFSEQMQAAGFVTFEEVAEQAREFFRGIEDESSSSLPDQFL